jgi:hypothetical protein
MNNHFDASPFAAGFSAAVIDRLAQAQAILSLSMHAESDAVTDSTCRMAQAAALNIVDVAVAGLTFGAGADVLEPDIAATVTDSLTQAQAVISVIAHRKTDSATQDELELASGAAIGFLREAMEALEQEAA